MELLDTRRLTGPSVIADGPGTIADVRCEAGEVEPFAREWKRQVRRMHEALGWPAPVCVAKRLLGGVSVAFSAPVDALYAATELNEWAYHASVAESGRSGQAADFSEAVEALRAAAASEANPALLQLMAEARKRNKSLLWDDDDVSLGLGRGSRTWPVREPPADVHWDDYHDVPVGLVTGTNGKTTTVRLAAQIVRAAGRTVGLSSTDWIAVDDRIVDRGDWSGPGGARAVLREPQVDVAILESARGGLLRRGLGVDRADAAVITNIAEDHLGDFGSRSLEELLDVKWIVSRPVRHDGVLILNAEDDRLVAKSADHRGHIAWFALDQKNPVVQKALLDGGCAFVLEDDELTCKAVGQRTVICRNDEIPVTLGGAARHNTANALAAAALTHFLGLPPEAIRRGLKSMQQQNNPGRCNVYDLGGVCVLVDFAHNPAAMTALFDMAQALPAERRVLCFGQAGDRPDRLIREMTRDACAIGLDQVVVSELADYHRGRTHGEVFAVIRDELLRCGFTADRIAHHEQELESFEAARCWARPGDLIIMLALGGAAPVQQRLEELGAVQRA